MKVDVWFMPDNQVTVSAETDHGIKFLSKTGAVEELTEEIRDDIARLEDTVEALKTALARILYTPMGWD